MKVLNDMTAEAMDARARELSRGGYAAIVEIVRYMQGESFLTIMSDSRRPIAGFSRRGEAVFVVRQWRDGQPWSDPRDRRLGPAKPLVDIGGYVAPDGLPF